MVAMPIGAPSYRDAMPRNVRLDEFEGPSIRDERARTAAEKQLRTNHTPELQADRDAEKRLKKQRARRRKAERKNRAVVLERVREHYYRHVDEHLERYRHWRAENAMYRAAYDRVMRRLRRKYPALNTKDLRARCRRIAIRVTRWTGER